MADQTRGRKIGDEVLDELLAGQDPAEAFRSGTLIDDLKKAVAERALDAEMEAHLEREGVQDAGNHRNGHNRKRVLTDTGAMDLEVPRDRFEPQLVEKYVRRLPGFDDKVISMYARGMTTREIRGHVGELYGLSVSPELVSKVTDAVHACSCGTGWRSGSGSRGRWRTSTRWCTSTRSGRRSATKAWCATRRCTSGSA